MFHVQDLLEARLGIRDWNVQKPRDGLPDMRAFIARHGATVVFVKLDVRPAVMDRLAALGVAPALLDAGVWEGREYVVQEYVEGVYPNRSWSD